MSLLKTPGALEMLRGWHSWRGWGGSRAARAALCKTGVRGSVSGARCTGQGGWSWDLRWGHSKSTGFCSKYNGQSPEVWAEERCIWQLEGLVMVGASEEDSEQRLFGLISLHSNDGEHCLYRWGLHIVTKRMRETNTLGRSSHSFGALTLSKIEIA